MTQNRTNYNPTQYYTLVGSTSGNISSVSPGTSSQVYTSNGSSSNPSYQDYPTLAMSQNLQVITSTGTYTPTSGTKWIKVTAVGGGGAGGGGAGTATQCATGGGGQGGSTSQGIYYVTSFGTSVSVTIGAGGTGVSGNNAGNAGGTTSFGSLLTAPGGSGGLGSASSTGFCVTLGGGSASAGTGGYLNVVGNSGLVGWACGSGAIAAGGVGGRGGCSFYGGDSNGIYFTGASHSDGQDAVGYGGGGGGGVTTDATNVAGGDGFAGVVIVEEWVFS